MEKHLQYVVELINGHHDSENREDISIVLDMEDALEVLDRIDLSLYEEGYYDVTGDYLIISSCVEDYSACFVENLHAENGEMKIHETDILILPHYLPQEIKEHFAKNCDSLQTIEI